MDWYTYMIRAADHSKYNGSHWFRYLRKVIFENGSKLTAEDLSRLLQSKKSEQLSESLTKICHAKGFPYP